MLAVAVIRPGATGRQLEDKASQVSVSEIAWKWEHSYGSEHNNGREDKYGREHNYVMKQNYGMLG